MRPTGSKSPIVRGATLALASAILACASPQRAVAPTVCPPASSSPAPHAGPTTHDREAIAAVRHALDELRGPLAEMRAHVDHAADLADLIALERETASTAPTHPPDVDQELLEWIRAQPAEPPFDPGAYAGRASRLRADVVQQLVLLTIELNQSWRELEVLARSMDVARVRASRDASAPGSDPMGSAAVAFIRTAAGQPPIAFVAMAGPADAHGGRAISGNLIPPGTTRRVYRAHDLSDRNVTDYVFQIDPNAGIATQIRNAQAMPWNLYRSRLREIVESVHATAQTYDVLMQAFSSSGGE